jgi:hypothetical protein
MAAIANTAEPLAKKPFKFRRLRIVWTVFFAVLTVALCVLWVRSYWWLESVHLPVARYRTVIAASVSGVIGLSMSYYGLPLEFTKRPANDYADERVKRKLPPISSAWFSVRWTPNGIGVVSPDWFLVSTFVAVATVPWLRSFPYRFSLRTMLIAITLVAVVLGLVFYSHQ